MSAVQITGCSGAGKSTIAGLLARCGLAAIDADDDPWLARMVDAAGNVVGAAGAIPIDARQPLDQVVDAILSHAQGGGPAMTPIYVLPYVLIL